MKFLHFDNRQYVQFPRLSAAPGLRHGYTTRPQNVSPKPGPDMDICAENRAQAARDFGFSPAALCYTRQIHKPNLAVIEEGSSRGVYEGVDGLITRAAGVPLMTFSADCPLILVYDPARRVLGMVHSSWRCTVALATSKLVDRMRSEFGVASELLLAGIGPSAGPENYEVGEEVVEAAGALPERDAHFVRREGKIFFDLWSANRALLMSAGVPEENIETAEICTMDRTDLFYSYRREGAGCGHFGLLAGIVDA
ncbi:MAG: polyphenol oxidase family protein [Phycisphaerae bacterium]